jgi:hypothetical protein
LKHGEQSLKVEGSEKWGVKCSEVQCGEVKISGEMCVFLLIYSYQLFVGAV